MKRPFLFIWLYISLAFIQSLQAGYSFRVIVKYPFGCERIDSLGNVVLDSLVRARPVKAIIFRTEVESLYQQSITNDSGYATFTFERWSGGIPVEVDGILRMAIDFPNTDRVIKENGQITFEPLRFDAVDFQKEPGEIEIILPMSVYRDEFIIGDPSTFNICNFAIMNDMHLGNGFSDFGTPGFDDEDIGQTNRVTDNNENILRHIKTTGPLSIL